MRRIFCEGSSIKPMGEKDWVEVYFEEENLYWVPKLKHLAEILQQIGRCEDKKYGFGDGKPVKGAGMVKEFILKAILGYPIEKLIEEYKIPV